MRRSVWAFIFRQDIAALVALTSVPLLLVDLGKGGPLPVSRALDWVVVAYFIAEYAYRLALATDRRAFVRRPFNLLMLTVIVAPFLGLALSLSGVLGTNWLASTPMVNLLRPLRVVARIGAIGRHPVMNTLHRNRLEHFLAIGLLIMLSCAAAFYSVETRAGHALTFGDAVWWGVGYITTVGSEIVPHTGLGRVLGGILQATGLVVAGVFTANVVSVFQVLRSEQRTP